MDKITLGTEIYGRKSKLMQKIIRVLILLLIVSSIIASLGFTSRNHNSEHLNNSSDLDSYVISDESSFDYINSNLMVADSTDSLNNLKSYLKQY